MHFFEYQEKASRTAKKQIDQGLRYADAALGLAGETGEVADYLKKGVFHKHEIDSDKLAEELGDVLWYVSEIATSAGLDLNLIASSNLVKLQKRYPEGFSEERSKNREEDNNGQNHRDV